MDFEEDSLYEGFNYSIDLAPPQTASKPPGSAYRGNLSSQMGRNAPPSRLNTGINSSNEARPMTSVSGAGFSSNPKTTSRAFDPLSDSKKGPAPKLKDLGENAPEDMAKVMEAEVHRFLEQSALASKKEDFMDALELAKEAGKKERMLSKFKTANSMELNMELTYGVLFNLANAYHSNDMLTEALSSYSLIVKNKQFAQAGRLRVNMGNIHYQQQKYPSAIKLYRMALDQIPNAAKKTRYKIMKNIGNAFVKMGQFQDAIQSYEEIMENTPEYQIGFNLMVCYYALGDGDKMKKGFSSLSEISVDGADPEMEEDMDENPEDGAELDSDGLQEEIRKRTKKAKNYILTAAKLCAPILDRQNWVAGYNWVIDIVKTAHKDLASEMEICKAVHFLKEKQFEKAIDMLKSFEKKDFKLKSMAAINLSFLYFIEGDIPQADKYANLAVKHQRYNAKALVNKGNCLVVADELDSAKQMYLEAIGVEADCIEGIYNLGLVNKKMGSLNESLQAFEKLHTIVPTNTEVIFQIANLHDMMHNYRQAAKWFNILITCFGTTANVADPGVFSRLGQIFNKDDDETQAFHYHLESYRYFPVNLDVISWLGVWYVKSELYEKSIQFFERASQIQPHEIKWRLMVTSCYRRMGNYQKALLLYEKIHKDIPDNLECLRYLVAICKDLGKPYDHHQQELAKLERLHAARTQTMNGALTKFGNAPSNNYPNPNEAKQARVNEPPASRVHESKPPSPQRSKPSSNPSQTNAAQPKKKVVDVEQSDDWGDADVGDLLG